MERYPVRTTVNTELTFTAQALDSASTVIFSGTLPLR